MIEKNKKLFPKIKKQLKDFLTDESGEITKKDALGIAAGAVILAGSVESVNAHWSISYGWSPSIPGASPGATLVSNPVCSHVSGVVNGHFSQIPNLDETRSGTIHKGVQTHTSHSSHGSGGWC